MQPLRSHGHVFGGSLLIAGTTIGVGMLGLPIATGPGGFWPSIVIYVSCWIFMLMTGLLMLEVCRSMPNDSNLISMAGKFLGKTGKMVCWFVYLFLFEMVMIAHIVGGGDVFSQIFGERLSQIQSILLYSILFSPVVYLGTRTVDRLNIIMFSGVMISYFLFIFVSYQHVDLSLLSYQNWSKAWLAIPILFTAFTYQVIVPTLMTYMNRNVKNVRKAIFFGSSIPLVVYLIWQILILGIVPVEGENGLIAAAQKGQNAVAPLKFFVQSLAVNSIARAFAFFTMTTSYIALALAFVDFLADGLKVKKVGSKKALLCLAIFVPPTVIACINPNLFLIALGYAGGISCAILFGLFPPLMAWVARYKMGLNHAPLVPGGKVVLTFLIVLIIMELGLQLSSLG